MRAGTDSAAACAVLPPAHPMGVDFDARPIPLVGRIAMDLTICDVTGHPAIGAGDWLELMGPRCAAGALAEAAGTNADEILTGPGPRIVRTCAA